MYDFRKITAIIQLDKLESVEKSLQAISVPGISVAKVKGYGEYTNFLALIGRVNTLELRYIPIMTK